MQEKFRLNSMFTDNMVLQRDCSLNIWGEAQSGSKVEIEIGNQIKSTMARNGEFLIKLDPLKCGEALQMIVRSNNREIRLNNIVVGDVFIAAGQSNMEYRLKDDEDGREEIDRAYNENIRYYNVPQIEYEDKSRRIPDFKDGAWQVCSKETSKDFSAVAHYFAKRLYNEVKIPIGIINCNKGGTSASCWMSEKYLSYDKEIKKVYLEEYLKAVEGLTEEEEDRKNNEYIKTLEDYNKKIEKYKKDNPQKSISEVKKSVGHTPWPPPFGKKSYLRPSGLYNTMLKKVIPYNINAVLWYQGEEDTQNCTLYGKLFRRLIENFREDFEDDKLEFIFVQLPYYNDDKKGKMENSWAILRDEQLSVMRKVDNVDMVVALDCGEEFNIHPTKKKPVGERLALLVINKLYKKDIAAHSPIYKSFEIKEDKVIINFDFVKKGELTVKDGEALKGFEICGEMEFVKASAYIEDDKVVVYNNDIKCPKAVRYGWRNYDEVNLYNKAGLPAGPFRTDREY
ncbi:sialate O-acetylesterase [Clostridium felsineum]|uniref:sialate O-acetylesterase n=1 Tax=Clostridium felsineum TaxID=36839 RepID=UPI00214D7BBC|nr:sialate O-acetylesterase [Clostridium felsineum]MCR3760882.1 sialate O-acetylesterase [Clostridium felsineum]